jgi:uncharacterized membrane protein YqiK
MSQLKLQLNSVEEQREFFLWKFGDIERSEVTDLERDFVELDINKRSKLNEHEAMMLMDRRGSTMTASELRAMIAGLFDEAKLISFVEFCCAIFKKNAEELNDFASESARAKALEDARIAAEAAREAELKIQMIKEAEEAEAQARADQLEAESKMVRTTILAARSLVDVVIYTTASPLHIFMHFVEHYDLIFNH